MITISCSQKNTTLKATQYLSKEKSNLNQNLQFKSQANKCNSDKFMNVMIVTKNRKQMSIQFSRVEDIILLCEDQIVIKA